MHQIRRENLPVPVPATGGLHRSSTSGYGAAMSGPSRWRQIMPQLRTGYGGGGGGGGDSDGPIDVAPAAAATAARAALTSQLSRWRTAAAATRHSVRSGLEHLRRHGLQSQAEAVAHGAGARRSGGIVGPALPLKMAP
jgi:hypothetical protein